MKVIVTNKQLQLIREISDKEFSCEKCDHSWEIDKDDAHPYLCHMCGYESSKNEYNYDELEKFWKNYKKEDFPEHTDPKTGYVSPSSKVITDICEKEKFCKRQGPITFGQLKSIVEAAQRKNLGFDIGEGFFKALVRLFPWFFPQIAIAGFVGSSIRAFNKVVRPGLEDTTGYKSWWGKTIMRIMDVAEGDLPLGDPISKIFFISDGLLHMLDRKHKLKFTRYIADVAASKDDSEPVPEFFVENELRNWVNQKFLLDPPLPPKVSNIEETFWNDYKDILSEGKKDPLNLSKKDMKSLIDQGKKHMGYSEEEAKEEIESIIQSIKNLPSEIKLFRIIRADDRKDIDTKTPGSHYAKNKKDLLSSHSFADGVGDFSFMITVLASKELMDIDQTIYNNLLYPNENEVTLKNKGEGVKIVSIRKITNQKEVNEKWSEKYKKSINCNNPEGFSQRAHCQGRKKRLKESKNDPPGYDIDKIKEALLIASKLSTTFGEGIPLEFKLYGYNYKPSEMLMNRMDLYIDVNSEDGVYDVGSDIWHDISMNILDLFSMIGIRDEGYMKPLYDFKFNKRPLYDIIKV